MKSSLRESEIIRIAKELEILRDFLLCLIVDTEKPKRQDQITNAVINIIDIKLGNIQVLLRKNLKKNLDY